MAVLEIVMGKQHEVVIPAGTLIHVGGLPFQIKTDTTVYGRESNLAEGLKALAESRNTSNTGADGSTA